MSAEVHAWTVPDAAAGERLDRHVSAVLERPRNQVQRWVRDGVLTVDGSTAKPSFEISAGQRIRCEIPAPADERVMPEFGSLSILHEDEHFVVVDKPAELIVHPGAGHRQGTLAHRLLDRFPEIVGIGGPGRPGIVHRLDRGTSGVMVVARTRVGYEHLSRAFADRRVAKTYLALAYGRPRETSGRIEAPIGRHPQRRQEMAVVSRGRPAVTIWRQTAFAAGVSRFEIDLLTGRTHQIRVHFKSIGHPLIGDPVYGEARWKDAPRPLQRALRDFPRPALHAWKLGFAHPVSGAPQHFEAPIPEDLASLWAQLTAQGQ